ncbi:dynein light chain Tctex-type 5-like [Babylonia areolata]|uniref:dynein light chain Tctex-type 5-like n=1 Tax=Babylonia areolata TaxID=304850 RepID=UPI003FD573F6
MNTAPALRRQSIVDAGGTGVPPPRPSSSSTAAATAAATATAATSGGNGHRATFLMTPSQQGRRPSLVNAAAAQPVPSTPSRAYENSYRVTPEKPFSAVAARSVLREVMEEVLEGQQYDQHTCRQLTTSLADAIKTRVKELGHPRYKIVTNVAIGQAGDATLAFASRCVWNDSFDSFAEYTFRNGSLYAVGLVHALYCD